MSEILTQVKWHRAGTDGEYSIFSDKQLMDVIALVREHDKTQLDMIIDLSAQKVFEAGIRADERQRCIDAARKVKDETGFVIYGDGSRKDAFNAGAAAVIRALEKQE